MPLAVRCPECGRVISSSRGGPASSCPFCLAMAALIDVETPDPAAHSTAAVEWPAEVAKAGASARLGKYVRVGKLGSGGMGDVWKAWDSELERWVALKLLRHDDPRELERFTREARTAAGLSHANIAAVYEAGEVGGTHFIAMQLVVGRTLDRWVGGELRQVVTMVRDAARAVGFAHKRGIVHRDLKPTNLMVEIQESGPHVVVMDFGLARRIEGAAKLSGTGTLAGTPGYMSPEQSRGGRADARSDVHSLGVTLYELLTGRPPFESDDLYVLLRKITDADPAPPRSLNRKINRDLDTIILKCLEKDPARRYPTGEALARDLDRWLAGDPILARPAGVISRVGRKLTKRRTALVAAATGTVLAGAVMWWFLVGLPTSEHDRQFAEAMSFWSEATRAAGAGGDPQGISRKARKARFQFEKVLQVRESAKAQMMRGRSLQLEGNDGEALKALERAHELNPDSAEERLELAKALILKFRQSRGVPLQGWVGDDSSGGMRLRAGKLHAESPKQKNLKERGERLIADLNPTPEQKGLLGGLLLMGQGEFSKAAKELAIYSHVERWDVQGWCLLAQCCELAHDLKATIESTDQCLSRRDHIECLHRRGNTYYMMRRFDEAIADYDSCLRLDTKCATAFFSRRFAKSAKGLYEESLADLEKAIELEPNNPGFLASRGVEMWNRGRHAEALNDQNKALELAPDFALAFANRGIVKSDMGRYQEAIVDLNRAIELDPNSASYHNDRGIVWDRMREFDKGIADQLRAIELDPQWAKPHLSLGLSKTLKGHPDEALQHLNRAIELEPGFVDALVARGSFHISKKQFDAALLDLDKAIELLKGNKYAHVQRAAARAGKGLHKEALVDLIKALEIDDHFAPAYIVRGRLNLEMNLLEDAIMDLSKAIELDDRSHAAYSYRGLARFRRGIYQEAILDLTKAIELDVSSTDPYVNRGLVLATLGRPEEAIVNFTTAITLDPTNVLALDYRGRAEYTLRRHEQAMADWKRAQEADPKYAPAHVFRAHALLADGFHEDAMKGFLVAIQADSNSPDAYCGRGLAYECKGLNEEAKSDYEKALTIAPAQWVKAADVRERLEILGSAKTDYDARALWRSKKYRDAIEKWSSLLSAHPGRRKAYFWAYSIACCHALMNEKEDALDWLDQSVAMGFKQALMIEMDPDFDSLRGEHRYKELVNKLKKGSAEK